MDRGIVLIALWPGDLSHRTTVAILYVGSGVLKKVQIAVLLVEGADRCLACEVACPLGVPLADLHHVGRQLAGRMIAILQVFLEISAVAANRIAELCKALQKSKDVFQL